MPDVEFEIKREKKHIPKLPRFPIESLKVGDYFEVSYDGEIDCYSKRHNIGATTRSLTLRKNNPLKIKITITKMYDKTGKELNKLKVKRIA